MNSSEQLIMDNEVREDAPVVEASFLTYAQQQLLFITDSLSEGEKRVISLCAEVLKYSSYISSLF